MTLLIIGLGNIGRDYHNTRHNAGFMTVEAFATAHSLHWQEKAKFKAAIAETTLHDTKIILAKPLTYMNHSGQAVRALKNFYKLTNSHILVVHDELALPLGTLRTRIGGSDAGNNGVKSLIQHIGEDFVRLRIGVLSGEVAIMGAADFVLDTFDPEELTTFTATIQPKAIELISNFITGSFEPTTHRE